MADNLSTIPTIHLPDDHAETISAPRLKFQPSHPSSWAAYTCNKTITELRGHESLHPIPVPLEMLKQHKEWISVQGKVYNVSHYFDYHPGGSKILKGVGGTDATDKFSKLSNFDSSYLLIESSQ
jgi:cytochrome b involved in lipid metabolism